MSSCRTFACVTALIVALLVPSVAPAAVETGRAEKDPWSGYWYPRKPLAQTQYNMFGAGGPLEKFDRYRTAIGLGAGAQWWEYNNRREAADWAGYCHAWAAASILSPEPQAVTRSGVAFTKDEAEALVTATYDDVTFSWLSGVRNNSATDTTSDAYKDVHPAWLDYLTRYYLGVHRYPFIIDVNANSEVWNYPVYAYHRSSTKYAGDVEDVTLTLYTARADFGVSGTRYDARTYTYRLTPGTLGQYFGASVHTHPDYAWVPTGKRTANPYVTEQLVEGVVGLDI